MTFFFNTQVELYVKLDQKVVKNILNLKFNKIFYLNIYLSTDLIMSNKPNLKKSFNKKCKKIKANKDKKYTATFRAII